MSATLANAKVLAALLHFPEVGVWSAELELADPVTLVGAVSLVVEDLTLACTVVRGGPVEGSASYLVTGGAGGWSGLPPGKPLLARPYRNDAGVKLSTVLADAAKEAGERISLATDRSIGATFARQAGAGWNTLARLCPSWWMDPAGVTQVGPRAATPITAKSRLLGWKRKAGLRILAADTLAPFVPGALLEGAPLREVVLRVTRAATRIEVRQ